MSELIVSFHGVGSGTLLSLSVEAGQKVETGQQIAVVEAMKMQVRGWGLFCSSHTSSSS